MIKMIRNYDNVVERRTSLKFWILNRESGKFGKFCKVSLAFGLEIEDGASRRKKRRNLEQFLNWFWQQNFISNAAFWPPKFLACRIKKKLLLAKKVSNSFVVVMLFQDHEGSAGNVNSVLQNGALFGTVAAFVHALLHISSWSNSVSGLTLCSKILY